MAPWGLKDPRNSLHKSSSIKVSLTPDCDSLKKPNRKGLLKKLNQHISGWYEHPHSHHQQDLFVFNLLSTEHILKMIPVRP